MKTDNELIAEFMEFVPEKSYMTKGIVYRHPDKAGVYGKGAMELQYDTSWDWLMPVGYKIGEYTLAYPDQVKEITQCKVIVRQDILYQKVVTFIKWLNLQPK